MTTTTSRSLQQLLADLSTDCASELSGKPAHVYVSARYGPAEAQRAAFARLSAEYDATVEAVPDRGSAKVVLQVEDVVLHVDFDLAAVGTPREITTLEYVIEASK